jgi:hypothetical protein
MEPKLAAHVTRCLLCEQLGAVAKIAVRRRAIVISEVMLKQGFRS